MKFKLLVTLSISTALEFTGAKSLNPSVATLLKQVRDPNMYTTGSFVPALAPRLYLSDDGCAYVRLNGQELTTLRRRMQSPVMSQVYTPSSLDDQGGEVIRIPPNLDAANGTIRKVSDVIEDISASKAAAGVHSGPGTASSSGSIYSAIASFSDALFGEKEFTPANVAPYLEAMRRGSRDKTAPARGRRGDETREHFFRNTPNKALSAHVPLPHHVIMMMPDLGTFMEISVSENENVAETLTNMARDNMRQVLTFALDELRASGFKVEAGLTPDVADVLAVSMQSATNDVIAELFALQGD